MTATSCQHDLCTLINFSFKSKTQLWLRGASERAHRTHTHSHTSEPRSAVTAFFRIWIFFPVCWTPATARSPPPPPLPLQQNKENNSHFHFARRFRMSLWVLHAYFRRSIAFGEQVNLYIYMIVYYDPFGSLDRLSIVRCGVPCVCLALAAHALRSTQARTR